MTFKGIRLWPGDADPWNGEIGLRRIEQRMQITGRDFSAEVRNMLTYADKHLPPHPPAESVTPDREYVRTPEPLVDARDGDKAQARSRVNRLVVVGAIPRPNDLPCVDCGHVWTPGQRRHEYDHHLGYAAEFHEVVEPVCITCHVRREKERRDREKERARWLTR